MGRRRGQGRKTYITMICDFHTHFIPKDIAGHTSFFKGIWSDKQALISFLDINNIQYAHLVYPSTDAQLKIGWKTLSDIYNSQIAALAKEYPQRFICSGLLPLDEPDLKASIKKIKNLGFKSISLASSYNGEFALDKFKNIFSLIEESGLVVFIHPQIINPIGFDRVNDPLLMPVLEYSLDISMCLGLFMMQGGFLEFKDLKIVFSSLGGVIPFLKDRFDTVYTMLRERNMVKDLKDKPSSIMKRAYADLSGIKSSKVLGIALDFFPEQHILFGSDYPASQDITGQLHALSGFDDNLKDNILYKNFLNLFNIG